MKFAFQIEVIFMDKKYCDGLDCAMCGESEPCIYREANELQKQVETLDQELQKYKQAITNIDYALVGISDRTAIYKLYIVRELVDDALSDMDGE